MQTMLFQTKSIHEITRTLIDYRGATPEKSSNGVWLITAKVIKGGFIVDGQREYVPETTYDYVMRRGIPQFNDIVITTEAPLGEVARLRISERIALAQRVILLRGNPDIIDQDFYFYALRSPFVQAGLYARATGTTVLGIKQVELRQVQIPCPPLPIQQRIAAILSAYDDLIENNTRRIQALEQAAHDLYREWFVHFRFPGHESVDLVDSGTEYGMIPRGWAVVPLGEIAKVNANSIRNSDEINEIEYVDISSVGTGYIQETQFIFFAEAPSRARRRVAHGDIIWATVRPNRRQYALILNPSDNLIASTGFAVISAERVSYSYLYETLTTEEFAEYLTNRATGSAYPAVSSSDFKEAYILVPRPEVEIQYHNIVSDIYQEKYLLQRKNNALREARDLLLPRLVSGELDVSEVDIDLDQGEFNA